MGELHVSVKTTPCSPDIQSAHPRRWLDTKVIDEPVDVLHIYFDVFSSLPTDFGEMLL